jgi:hypothetical protein
MRTFCGAFPLLPGKTEAGREFAEALKRQGVTRESWFLQETPQGDMVVVYFEAQDVEKAFEVQARSKARFEVWFKQQVKSVTGFDLEQPRSESPPEEILQI